MTLEAYRKMLFVEYGRDPNNPQFNFDGALLPLPRDEAYFYNGKTVWNFIDLASGWQSSTLTLDDVLSIVHEVRGDWPKLPELLDKISQHGGTYVAPHFDIRDISRCTEY